MFLNTYEKMGYLSMCIVSKLCYKVIEIKNILHLLEDI